MADFRFAVASDEDGGGDRLVCPVCGFDYVHIAPVGVWQDGTLSMIHRSGSEDIHGEKKTGRGALLAITFWCEGGHRFSYRFQFHKGQTFVKLQSRDMTPDEDRVELWRD